MALTGFRKQDGGPPELPTTVATPHGIYKRKYHLRALFQSIAFVALLGSYHVYNKFQGVPDAAAAAAAAATGKLDVFASSSQQFQEHAAIPAVQHRRLLSTLNENDVEGEYDLGTTMTDAADDADLNAITWNFDHDRYLQEGEENGNFTNFTTTAQEKTCDELEIAEPGWWTALYAVGVLYMFLAIAIVCDEFFVEALEEISSERHMNIDKDVAGATLMAAGGSAPELFTNLFGTFDESEIGFGTILGSAAFNVLLVIAACSLAAKETLDLTWWPLFRDCSYYALNLVVLALLVGVSSPDTIEAWEAVILFLMYIGYVLIMWKNREIHKSLTGKELAPQDLNDDTSSGEDESGNLESVKEKFDAMDKDENGGINEEKLRELLTTISASEAEFKMDEAVASIQHSQEGDVTTWEHFSDWYRTSVFFERAKSAAAGEEDESEPIWGPLLFPEDAGILGNFWHLLQLPIVAALTFTTPDVRRQGMGKWCYVSFFIAILWIGVFAYFMVGWTEIIGNTIGVPHVVMGYTVLAAGTSVPDLLSSVIVTRQGSGDMAISSSIGSNIFDITVGLPIPWLIFMAFPDRPNTIHVSG